ncbi:MAG: hypothetical protein VX640_06900 [Pseudomonadota bacterium]|nr:hypothetical protein [Pseudomonadota bacterium]
MRARNRDINIFNLSLMDVICGAMGAFLIIMIILARYYVFDPNVTSDMDELRLRLDAAVQGLNRIRGGTEGIITELIDEADASTRGLGAAGDTIEQIEALTQGIRGDVDLVRGQLGAVQAEANRFERELQEKSAQLKRAEERIDALEMRHALIVSIEWDCPYDVDLFVESDRIGLEDSKAKPAFDPRVRRSNLFKGDAVSDAHRGPTAEMMLVGDTPKDTRYKVFVNLRQPAAADAECRVGGHALGYEGYFQLLPWTTLTASDYFDYLGVFSVDERYAVAFETANPKTRDAEIGAVKDRMATTPAPKAEEAGR